MTSSDKSKLNTIASNADDVQIKSSNTTGAEVGIITINGVATSLYAPKQDETYTGAMYTNLTTGRRNDGTCWLYKYGKLVLLTCDLITGGYTNIVSNWTIPVGYRPTHTIRISTTLQASGNVTGYGYICIDPDGKIDCRNSHASDAEIMCSAVWYTAE